MLAWRYISGGQVRYTPSKLDLVPKQLLAQGSQDLLRRTEKSRLIWALPRSSGLLLPVGLTGFEPATP
jgi:hypothetical protein